MSDNSDDFVLFAGIALHEETQNSTIRIGPTRSEIDTWKASLGKDLASDDDDKTEDETAIDKSDQDGEVRTPADEIAILMTEFREAISSFQTLIILAITAIPMVRDRYIKTEIFNNKERGYQLIEEDGGFHTFGITEEHHRNVIRDIERLREMDQAAKVFPSSMLLSLVSTFDSYFSEAIRIVLRSRSQRWTNSTETITLKDLLAMDSFDDAIEAVIEREIDSIMRGSHDDQVRFVETELNIKIRDYYDEWGKFIEIFERRNLAAHGNCVVNKKYLEICNQHKHDTSEIQLGEKLVIDGKYLRRSASQLLEFGVLLGFVLWRKHFPQNKEDAYKHLNDISFQLIRSRNSRVASRILDFALFHQTPNVQDYTQKMMTINLANALKKSKEDARAQEVIKKVDWSASADEFKISLCALEGNVSDFVILMPRFANSYDSAKIAFREWPVFDWVREEDEVRQKFFELYDEPLIQTTEEETTNTGEPPNPAENDTVH